MCIFYMYWCVCAYAWSCMCFSCVFLYHAHVSVGPPQFLSAICCWQQSQGQFLGLSPRFVCGDPWNVQECGLGQVERCSSETDTQTQPPLPPLSPPKLVFPPPRYTLPAPSLSCFPSLCVWRMNVRKPLSSFLSAHGEQRRKAGRQTGEKRLI